MKRLMSQTLRSPPIPASSSCAAPVNRYDGKRLQPGFSAYEPVPSLPDHENILLAAPVPKTGTKTMCCWILPSVLLTAPLFRRKTVSTLSESTLCFLDEGNTNSSCSPFICPGIVMACDGSGTLCCTLPFILSAGTVRMHFLKSIPPRAFPGPCSCEDDQH